mmetsp:Transcript_1061/g.3258  ORF Transcript_1061/g.3258 Transcript_1061/m.3258 type:complete len:230 (-) Transcript_1061:1718-2407(-)
MLLLPVLELPLLSRAAVSCSDLVSSDAPLPRFEGDPKGSAKFTLLAAGLTEEEGGVTKESVRRKRASLCESSFGDEGGDREEAWCLETGALSSARSSAFLVRQLSVKEASVSSTWATSRASCGESGDPVRIAFTNDIPAGLPARRLEGYSRPASARARCTSLLLRPVGERVNGCAMPSSVSSATIVFCTCRASWCAMLLYTSEKVALKAACSRSYLLLERAISRRASCT